MKIKESTLSILFATLIFSGIWGLAIILEDWSAREEYEREVAPLIASQARHDSIANLARAALDTRNYEVALQQTQYYLDNPELLVPKKEMVNLQNIILSEVRQKAIFLTAKQQFDSAIYYYRLDIAYEPETWQQHLSTDSVFYVIEHSSNPSQSIPIVDQLIATNPLDYSLLLKKADLYTAANQQDKALATLTKATQLIIKDYEARYGKGYAMVINPKKDKLPACQEKIFREYAKLLKEKGKYKKAASSKYWANFLAGKA